MPADTDAELVESFERLNAALLAEYLREPRRIRRSVSRDLARANPVEPKRPQYGAVARWVNRGLAPKRSPRACSEAEFLRDRARRAALRGQQPYTHVIGSEG